MGLIETVIFNDIQHDVILLLSVIILSAIMLTVIMLSVIMLSVIMLSVIMLSVIMLSVVMLSVVAPILWLCWPFLYFGKKNNWPIL
jgi:hypothetical protein